MGHVVSKQLWGTVDINTRDGFILVRQKWQYAWQLESGVSPWTYKEKHKFHNTADRQIWKWWSNRLRLKVSGTADVCTRFPEGLLINFDTQWVLSGGEWTVYVKKMPPESTPTSFVSKVQYSTREIWLDTADFNAYWPANSAGQTRKFYAVPHEFGHTFNNDDEYRGGSFLPDTNSIMNIGDEIRDRHLKLIIDTLNGMIPNCNFSFP